MPRTILKKEPREQMAVLRTTEEIIKWLEKNLDSNKISFIRINNTNETVKEMTFGIYLTDVAGARPTQLRARGTNLRRMFSAAMERENILKAEK